ncbi:hypothetical protein ACJRO7_034241, partial [Eucalyptus globulus]
NLPPGKHIIVKLGKEMQPIRGLGSFSEPLVVRLYLYEIPFMLSINLTPLLIFLFCSLSLIIFVPTMEKWILHSLNSKWRYWKSDLKAIKLSDANKADRAKQKIQHTLGNKSFSRITAAK